MDTANKKFIARHLASDYSPLAWEFRTLAVALFYSLPGVLFGALLRLVVPDSGPAEWWLAVGGVIGAILGGLMEADHIIG